MHSRNLDVKWADVINWLDSGDILREKTLFPFYLHDILYKDSPRVYIWHYTTQPQTSIRDTMLRSFGMKKNGNSFQYSNDNPKKHLVST